MEKEQLLETAYALRDEIRQDPLVVQSKALEKELMDDPEVIPLMIAFKKAEERYNDAQRFKLENMNVYASELSAAKAKLYQHPKVQKYFKAYEAAQSNLHSLAGKLFDDVFEDISVKSEKGR